MAKKSGLIWFVIYTVFGLYLINYPFQFVKIPISISSIIDQWAILIGGILVLIGGINHFRASKYKFNASGF